MSLDVEALARSMIEAARESVSSRWPALRALAETELRRLAQSLLDVHGLVQSGEIDETRAKQLMLMHQSAARSVLTTVKGIGLLTAEQAIAAAVRAVAQTVNTILKTVTEDGGKEANAEFKAGRDLNS